MVGRVCVLQKLSMPWPAASICTSDFFLIIKVVNIRIDVRVVSIEEECSACNPARVLFESVL